MKNRVLKIMLLIAVLSQASICKNVEAKTKEITVKSKGVQTIDVIQKALDHAKNDKNNYYKIKVEPGKYEMRTNNGLHIYSNTDLDMTGVTIKRTLSAGVGGMIVVGDPRREGGKSNTKGGGYTLGGYKRGKNITITGGTLNAGVGTSNVKAVSTLMTFSHVQNIKLKNMTFIYKPKKKDNAHSIEFGASKNVIIDGCKFYGNYKVLEALQLESAQKGVAHSDLMGKEDGTKTKNVLVKNCVFDHYILAMGANHGCKKDLYTINIKNNTFSKIKKFAICAYNFKGKVSGNIVKKSGKKKFDQFVYKQGSRNKLKISKNNKVRK
ncbi:Uncharacterised protein [uncultured Eubacterium sp.]|nr:Uncharacterised protein [uncultured Eubacterium sp.]